VRQHVEGIEKLLLALVELQQQAALTVLGA
jgi:hypothetical protein